MLSKPSEVSIIPQPLEVSQQPGIFSLSPQTKIIVVADNPSAREVASYLAEFVKAATGYQIPVTSSVDASAIERAIALIQAPDAALGEEGYRLVVGPNSISIRAQQAAGLFYGVQTLLHLLPPELFSKEKTGQKQWTIPCVRIKDAPRFRWRGMHLDVSRHFFSVEFIKKYIDLLAMHKMNVFHWHLTEDQGWRIEIKKYPKLTEVSAFRDQTLIGHARDLPLRFDGVRHGGFYSQSEITEVVEYARQRHITVVPEIEMPGHSVAALAAYPQLSCTGGPFKVSAQWGVHEDIYCAGNDSTFIFLQDVLTEVLELFPSQYIHIGGDEAPKARWQTCSKCQQRIKEHGLQDEHALQSYFVKRIEKFLNSKGRKLIGWDEILEGGLAPEATVMSWRGTKGGIAAAGSGHDVIMTPTSHCYFDYYQAKTGEPLAIGGYLPLQKVYSFEPVPEEIPAEKRKHILGAQGNVWTEYMSDPGQVEYMVLPRMSAMAEVVWSAKAVRDFGDFERRLQKHYDRLAAFGARYRVPPPEVPQP
ncbi:MAG: beta-N-acetylhexosaminidase [bacterium]